MKAKKRYAIYLSSNFDTEIYGNVYGYWTGSGYVQLGESFPLCERILNSNVRLYTSWDWANKALVAAINGKYTYVFSGYVEDIYKKIKTGENGKQINKDK